MTAEGGEEADLLIEPLDRPRSFRLSGEAALPAAASLRDLLAEVCRSPGDVTLDVADVSYMDSSGLRAIIVGCQLLADQGRIHLVNPGDQVRRLLELTGIERTIPNLITVER